MSKREFTDEEVNNYLNAKYDRCKQWVGPYLDYTRAQMHRLVEAGWTPPPSPPLRFYVKEVVGGYEVLDWGEGSLWAGFYSPSKADNRRDAEEYAARLNRKNDK